MAALTPLTLWTSSGTLGLDGLDAMLIWLCVGITAVAALFPVRLIWNLGRMRWLKGASRTAGRPERLTVIIPARNEEDCLEACARSILDQREIDLEMVIVNDHSTDRTGEIADELAGSDTRVRVIHDPPVEPGWLGKPNAMQKALETVSAEYVLFSDGDIHHAPGSVAAGLAELERRELGLVSLMPSFEFEGIWEHVLLPGYIGWMGIFLSPAVEDPESKAAAAAGAFLLVRTDALRKAGGLEAIRSEMVDDVALAARFKEHRIPVGFYLAPELLRVRLFKSPSGAFWGMTKNVLGAAPGGVLGVLLLAPLGIVCHAAPPVVFVLAAVSGSGWLAGAAALAYVSQLLGMLSLRRFFHVRPLRLLFYPLNPVPTVCCIGRALYHRWVHRSVLWRGRSLRVGE